MHKLILGTTIVIGFFISTVQASETCGVVEKITTNRANVAVLLSTRKIIEFRLHENDTKVSSRMLDIKLNLARNSMDSGHTFCVMGSGPRAEVQLLKN